MSHHQKRLFRGAWIVIRDPGDYEGKHRRVTITEAIAAANLKYADSEEQT